jgi:hypothetical protein
MCMWLVWQQQVHTDQGSLAAASCSSAWHAVPSQQGRGQCAAGLHFPRRCPTTAPAACHCSRRLRSAPEPALLRQTVVAQPAPPAPSAAAPCWRQWGWPASRTAVTAPASSGHRPWPCWRLPAALGQLVTGCRCRSCSVVRSVYAAAAAAAAWSGAWLLALWVVRLRHRGEAWAVGGPAAACWATCCAATAAAARWPPGWFLAMGAGARCPLPLLPAARQGAITGSMYAGARWVHVWLAWP